MTKPVDFYPRYIAAVFRRGKADELPRTYIDAQAEQVLSPAEMDELDQALQAMVDAGELTRHEDVYALVKRPEA